MYIKIIFIFLFFFTSLIYSQSFKPLTDTNNNGFLEINKPSDFLKITQNTNIKKAMEEKYELTTHMDMSLYKRKNQEEESLWSPIGTLKRPFIGVFEGNGYIISNFNYNPNNQLDNLGLFGMISNGAIVRNLSIINGYVSHVQKTKKK